MSFLNTALLAALTLGLLPILIHLLNRQRFKKIDFPTLKFLRELQRQKMRQVRVRQILLLILRTLAVLFLVLALTRPVLKSSAGILPGVEAKTTAVLIMDRSASMNTETPDGNRYRDIQARAQEILTSMKDGDEAQIIWADSKPSLFPESPTGNSRLLRDAVTESKAQDCGSDLTEALKAARQSLGKSQNLHKEVYLLSDFSVSAWPEKMPQSQLLPEDVNLFLLPAKVNSIHNLGITDAAITSRLISPGRPVEISFVVKNSGNSLEQDKIVSVYVNSRRVTQTRVSLSSGELKTVRLKFVPDEAGDQAGYVRVEEADDFAEDDQRYFVLRVPTQLKIAVVGNEGNTRDLVALGLNPANDINAFIQTRVFTSSQFESQDWSNLDGIFIVDASSFSGAFENRLHSFVEQGKGVFIILGPQSDLRSHNSWLNSLGLPALGEAWENTASPAKWKNTDLEHPLFEGLFEKKPTDISPSFSKFIRTVGGNATEIISSSAGIPAFVESKVGRGRALLFTSSPDPSWSTLFRSGIFPPLLVSSSAYLSGIGTSASDYQFSIGIPAALSFYGIPGTDRFELRQGNDIFTLNAETAGSGYLLKIPDLKLRGEYDLWKGNVKIAKTVVNVPSAESNLQLLKEEGYKSVLGGRITSIAENASIEKTISESRFGRELWKLCLYLALAFLITEMIVGRVGKKEAAVPA